MLWMEICEFDIAIQGSTMGYNKKSGGGGGGGGPAPFLVKTYEMVEERETNEVISWGEKGESFVVWKPAEFARDLLPRHFKHNNFSSFVRQLNTYGFKKVVPDRWEFTNDNFRRGEQSLLCNIQRRKPPAPSTSRLRPDVKPSACHKYDDNNNNHIHLPHSSTSNSGELQSTSSASSPPPPPLLPPPYPLPTHLRELANENEKLRKDNRILTAELSQVKCYLHELIGYLSEYVDVSKLDLSLQPGAELSEGMNEKEGGEGEATAAERKDGIKLFGVMLLRSFEEDGGKTHGGGKKRRCDGGGCSDGCGLQKRPLKMRFALPWMGISTPLQQGSSKVCH